jgi:hypothetical protein
MLRQEIHNICKKHPSWTKVFYNYFEIEGDIDIDHLKHIMHTIATHKQTLKQNNVCISYAISITAMKHYDHRTLLEILDDRISYVLAEHKINNFIKSLKTKNYRHLFDAKIEKEIRNILLAGITIRNFNLHFFKKIAYFKNDNCGKRLLISLQNFKLKNVHWNKAHYFSKMKDCDSLETKLEVLPSPNNTLMIHIKDYLSCKLMGPESWCIVQREEIFNNYTKDLNRQFIYLDFNLPIEDPKSLLGFTVDINGLVTYSYLRDDLATPDYLSCKFTFQGLSDEIILSHIISMENNKAIEFIFKKGLVNMLGYFINTQLDYTYYLLLSIKKNKHDFVQYFLNKYPTNFSGKTILTEFFPKINAELFKNLLDLETHSDVDDSHFNYPCHPSYFSAFHSIANEQGEDISDIVYFDENIAMWLNILLQSDTILHSIPDENWVLDITRFPYKEMREIILSKI